METTIPSATVRPSRRRDRLFTVLAATAATLLGWAVAVPLAGVELTARGGGAEQRVTPVAVAVSTVLAGLAGWALLALLERFTGRARTVWSVVAALVLLLSLVGPLTGGVGRAATVTLVILHLLAGAVLVPGLRRTAAR
ncbi:DUF6069 family protein [Micromonospora sp. WMMD1128]|uniref:DUF6069 family protein n=1 Tax=unclassified Micromonospora TaxID=2617518 RepID=UPI00248CAD1A|nr:MULTISPECIES: DUF6069 family protein [unclassified Micromonospora]WBB76433.1 DUF6069 family protein [Micromonospora sp. WMMD1128]WFE35783.1 DUF6069 family protein [Micromonospora sp. WMMD975]